MALNFFKKKSREGDGGQNGKDAGGGENSKRDPRKARSFFKHAETAADTRNYDYAIVLYLRGLHHEPDNMDKHIALRDVALKRKVSGGRPAGFRESLKLNSKDPIDRMLDAEGFFAKDPLNLKRMLAVMERAVDADAANNGYNLAEVAYWIGEMILDKGQTDKPPGKDDVIKVRDLYGRIGVWDKAVAACKLAIQLDPTNEQLAAELRDMEAELTILEGKYTQDSTASVRDMEKQKELQAEDTINKTPTAADELIAKRRTEVEDDSKDIDKTIKLVEALISKDTDPESEEAIKLLSEVLDQTGQYRFKERIGDVKIRSMTRKLKDLKAKTDAAPENAELRKEYEQTYRAKAAFELEEFTERVKNYPTDLSRKFELGRRLMVFKKFDEAIGMFQQSKSDPKYRSASHELLGRCYLAQEWLDEAVETLTQGLEEHKVPGDKLWLELAWSLIEAHERLAVKNKDVEQAKKAMKLASQVLQSNIGYRDIKTRYEKLRQLVRKLQDPKSSSSTETPPATPAAPTSPAGGAQA